MAATSAKRVVEALAVSGRSAPEVASPDHEHIPSPAQEIQARLNEALAERLADPDTKKWSARRSSFVILGVSGALWLGIAAIVRMSLS